MTTPYLHWPHRAQKEGRNHRRHPGPVTASSHTLWGPQIHPANQPRPHNIPWNKQLFASRSRQQSTLRLAPCSRLLDPVTHRRPKIRPLPTLGLGIARGRVEPRPSPRSSGPLTPPVGSQACASCCARDIPRRSLSKTFTHRHVPGAHDWRSRSTTR